MPLDTLQSIDLTTGVVGVALAAIIVLHPARVNRLLAGILVLTGLMGAGWTLEGEFGPGLQAPLYAAEAVVMNGLVALYVRLFAGLDSPLSIALRGRGFTRTMDAVLVLATALPMAALVHVWLQPPVDPDLVLMALLPTVLLHILAVLYTLAASVSAWRRSTPGTPAGERASAWALAFGLRDGGLAVGLLAVLGADLVIPGRVGERAADAGPWLIGLTVPLFQLLLAYGILRTQLVDLDLRVKQAIRVGVVVLVSLVWLSGSVYAGHRVQPGVGGIVGGFAWGALLAVVLLAPLRRAAARVADAALPGVDDSEAYLARRRLEVYQAAVADVLAEGGNADADPLLADLRASLRVSNAEHRALAVALRPRALGSGIPGFDVIRELGRGSGGRALLARDRRLDRLVVLKQPLGGVITGPDREAVVREARTAAAIRHPNVVGIHQLLFEREAPLIVQEYVEGESLAELERREGRLSAARVAVLARQVLDGLEAVHGAGVVHRDLKPANILVDRGGRARIVDFGIATYAADGTGVSGSPAYMSPEQAAGRGTTVRSDLYSLGVVLFEALTGRLPAAPSETLDPGSPRRAPLQELAAFGPLGSCIGRALQQESAERWNSAAEMRDGLAES